MTETLALYEQLADKVAEHIQAGLYQPGERLPSVRRLSERESVSISTVLAAYELLEQRRLLEARPKSGYFVLPQANERFAEPQVCCQPSRPVPAHISRLMMDIINAGPQTQNSFSCAVPARDTPIVRQLQRTFGEIARSRQYLNMGYGPHDGMPELRKQIALRSLDAGLTVSADDIIVTLGCQQALSLALRVLTKPGDVVAIESPCYQSFIQMIEAYGLQAIEIPAHPGEGMSLEALQLAMTQWPVRVVVAVPTYSNPLGSCMPQSRRRQLVQLLNDNDAYLIEDEVYSELSFYHHQRAVAVKAHDTEGRVLTCSSLSKTVDPQLRIGWIMPGRFYSEIMHQKYISTLSLPALPQLAAAQIMARGHYDRHIRYVRDLYSSRMSELVDLVAAHFPAQTRISRPQGGLSLWLELPREVDTTRLYYRAREHSITFSPGELFAMDHRYQHCMRIIFSQEWTDSRRQALAQLGAWACEASRTPG